TPSARAVPSPWTHRTPWTSSRASRMPTAPPAPRTPDPSQRQLRSDTMTSSTLPTRSPSLPDPAAPATAVVLGGGSLGTSIATHLARAGVQVTLATAGQLCDGASGRSLSWLTSAGDRSPAYHALRVLGVDRYRTLFATDPPRDWLRFTGGVWWDADETSASARARHADEVARGYDSHLLTGEDVVGAFPGVDAGAVIGEAVVNPGEGWVSLPHLVEHLAAELTERGGEIRTGLG